MKVWNYYSLEHDVTGDLCQLYVCDIRDLYKQKQIVRQDGSTKSNYIKCPADENYVIHSDDFVRVDMDSSASIITSLKKVLMESVIKDRTIAWVHQFKFDVIIVILASTESEEAEYRKID